MTIAQYFYTSVGSDGDPRDWEVLSVEFGGRKFGAKHRVGPSMHPEDIRSCLRSAVVRGIRRAGYVDVASRVEALV